MRHIVFLIAYIYFLYIDLKRKEIDLVALAVYAVLALVTIGVTKDDITMTKLVDIIYSIIFGLSIYLLSYFSGEGIGNLILFITGLLVAFIIGMFMFYFGKKDSRKMLRMPFMPCFLPAIIGYILCIA